MIDCIRDEMDAIISEGWTDGMAVIWGTETDRNSLFRGTISGSNNVPISENTIYDLASVTKLFLLVSILKLVQDGQLSLDAQIGEYTTDFSNIRNLKIYELMNFSKLLQTEKRIDACSSYDEAKSVLQNVQVVDGTPLYSDMGAIVLTQIIDSLPRTSYRDQISAIKDTCHLKSTFIWDELPKDFFQNLQNYDNEYIENNSKIIIRKTPLGVPHDSKARILGASGHAGLFSTPNDIATFSSCILSGLIVSPEILKVVCSTKYDYYVNEQHFGLLCYKKTENKKKSEIPALCSDSSFAISGFTGTYLLIDPEKRCYLSINSNRIYNRCTSNNTLLEDVMCTKNYVYRKDSLTEHFHFMSN